MPINYFRRSSKSMVTSAMNLSTRWLRRWENARIQGLPWSSYTVRTQSGMVKAAHMETDNSWSGLAAVSHGGKCRGRLGPRLGLPNLRLLPLPAPTSWKGAACFTYCFFSLSHHFSHWGHTNGSSAFCAAMHLALASLFEQVQRVSQEGRTFTGTVAADPLEKHAELVTWRLPFSRPMFLSIIVATLSEVKTHIAASCYGEKLELFSPGELTRELLNTFNCWQQLSFSSTGQ